ncbi:Protein kinase C iota type [Heterocephalus glaber]|uniref:protein kinase C n=1 Tax=Heterocephalus glaber TaxID=10181 RepID=G5AM77_HETGA|nr:Protein kinase C iota type [Heterocephalus glaber]
MPDVEIDIDDLLDAESEEERASKLQNTGYFQRPESDGNTVPVVVSIAVKALRCFSVTVQSLCCLHRLGCQIYKCTNCKLSVHRKCHKLVTIECGQHSLSSEPMVPVDLPSMASDPAHTVIPISTHEALEQVDEENEAGNTVKGDKTSSGLGLEDFDLLRVIGRGSYGKILLVQLKKSDHMYAMKAVRKEHFCIHQVQREQHILQQTSNCPFLVTLHACFQTESRLFLVLDYVSGGDLLFYVQQQSMLPEEHARFYFAEISLAVNCLHQQGIIHRNLKMENVLLDSEGHIKLTDCCLSKEGLQPGDTTHTFCGPPHFMAPEIIRGRLQFRCGLVGSGALGVLMYMRMIRESPFHLDECSDIPYEDSVENLFQVILERDIFIPCCLSVQAASILEGFLNRDPKELLGCHPHRGFADVQEHPFFQNVDRDMMERKQVVPPFKPNISEGFCFDNFDPKFTNQTVQLTPDDNDVMRELDGYEFAGSDVCSSLYSLDSPFSKVQLLKEEWV